MRISLTGTLAAISFLTLQSAVPIPAATLQTQTASGGFLEKSTSGEVRPLYSAAQIQAFVPSRGAFTFPTPYNTEAVRITNDSDCGGGDCVVPVGYSYWANMNNHTGSDTMLIALGLDPASGGAGPSLYGYNKVTEQVTPLGPLFDPSSRFRGSTVEGWYFSAVMPTAMYVLDGSKLVRYDVLSRQFSTVFDAASWLGAGVYLWQTHSSADDQVHIGTIRSSATYQMLGCAAFRENTGQFSYLPARGVLDECHLDKSGRWMVMLDNVDRAYGEDNRIIDLQTGTETLLMDQDGAAGHADMGHGYMVAEDNWASVPGAMRMWKLGQAPLTGRLVYAMTDWRADAGHVAHENSVPGVAPEQQYACNSNATRVQAPRSNEIVCYRLDGSQDVAVVAPVMTDLDAPGGGDDYSKRPKGNLDVTGRYFIWTSNMGGSRLDAFVVKVPSHLLSGTGLDITPPVVSITTPAAGAALGGSVAISGSASDDVGVVGVRFLLDGTSLGAEDATSPYSVSWNTTLAAGGPHTLTAVARDAAGNTATSAGVSVTVINLDTTAPAVSIAAPAAGASVQGTISVTATASDNVAVAGVQFKVDGASLGAEDATSPYSVSWNTTLAAGGSHTLTAVARDASGNTTTSTGVAVTVANATASPVISSVTASGMTSSGATIMWTTDVPSDSQVEYGPAVQYGVVSPRLTALVTAHQVTLTGLASGTLYHYRVTSRDSTGTTSVSGDYLFSTLAVGSGGLAGFWRLSDANGVAKDATSNHFDGRLMYGAAWAPGWLGQGIRFDGVNDFVKVKHRAALNAYPLTIVVSVKTTAAGLHGIVNKYQAGSSNGYQIFTSGGNLCAWYFADARNNIFDGTGCTLAVPGYNDGLWHQVVFVVDATGGTIFVDGAMKATRPWTGTPGRTTSDLPLSFARYPATTTPFLAGSLDEIQIYNRALQPTEVKDLYDRALAGGASR